MLDKEWIACDNHPSSPFRGHRYLSYSDIETLRLVTQTSTDGGRTWSARVGSPDNAGRRGIARGSPAPQPVSLLDGTVVIPFFDNDISVVRSTDGGATFSPATRIAPSFFSSDGGVRSGPFPSTEVGADGTVMMAWPDCSLSPGCFNNDFLFSKSADGLT